MNVNAIQQRPGDFSDIALNYRRRAQALVRFVVEETAGLRVSSSLTHP